METESTQPQPTSAQTIKNEKSERYALILTKREALEAKIQEKTEELKRLCIEEAELTGSIPPEIPLEPGEPVPTIRRRVGTSFALPENLINKVKSEEEEEQTVEALELQCEVQTHIVAAALHLLNNDTIKKALRRQRRIEYQQQLTRLHALEARLAQARDIRDARSPRETSRDSLKQRKKPRPYTDGESGGEPADREVGSAGRGGTMSPNKPGTGPYIDSQYPSTLSTYGQPYPYSHLHTDNKMVRPQERLHATLSAPQYSMPELQEYRAHRPHLQRLGSGGYGPPYGMYPHGMATTHYPTLTTCALPEYERLNRLGTVPPYWAHYPPEVERIQHLSTPGSQYGAGTGSARSMLAMDEVNAKDETDMPSRHPSLEGRIPRWNRNRFGSLDRKKHITHSSPSLECRSGEGLDALPQQVSERMEYLPTSNRGAYTLENMSSSSRIKDLDVRLESTTHSHSVTIHKKVLGDETNSQSYIHLYPHQHGTASLKKHRSTVSCAHGTAVATPGETLLPGQTYPEHNFGQILPQDRTLTRTQSLGSVETQNTSHNSAHSDTRSIKDMFPSTAYQRTSAFDSASLKKHKEKEWYETLLDSPAPSQVPSRRPSGHSNYDTKSNQDMQITISTSISVQALRRSPSHGKGSPTERWASHVQTSGNEMGGSHIKITHESSPAAVTTPHREPSELRLNLSPCEVPATSRTTVGGHQSDPPITSCQETHVGKSESTGNEYFDRVVPFESPKHHTVVQAGKWQPYWEVSKPFEMSDFYKYSTKFRKKAAIAKAVAEEVLCGSTPSLKQDEGSPTPCRSPQQKGIYQPLQPMTCQPVELGNTASVNTDSPKTSTLQRNKTPSVDPNSSATHGGETSEQVLGFPPDVLAWYQDKSASPRSATLV